MHVLLGKQNLRTERMISYKCLLFVYQKTDNIETFLSDQGLVRVDLIPILRSFAYNFQRHRNEIMGWSHKIS